MKKSVVLLALILALLMSGCGKGDAPDTEPLPDADVESVEEGDDAAAQEESGTEPTDYAAYMASVEEESRAICDFLENEAMTQADMNAKSQELYELWDGALNYLWGEVKKQLPEEEFDKLLEEQLAWIEAKEEAVAEAGTEVEGGSLYPLVVNSKAAELTEERVYQLYELVK